MVINFSLLSRYICNICMKRKTVIIGYNGAQDVERQQLLINVWQSIPNLHLVLMTYKDLLQSQTWRVKTTGLSNQFTCDQCGLHNFDDE